MDRISTKSKEAPVSSDTAPAAVSPQPISLQSFFNTALRPQAIGQPSVRVSLDPASFLLFTAILGELKTQNDLTLAQMKLDAEKKQEELAATKEEKLEDEKRFEEVGYSLYM